MKAMILAAGLGTRLLPVTRDLPKAMVPWGGQPMIVGLIERLISFGIQEIVVNLHHHADLLQSFLEGLKWDGLTIHFSDEREALLDTGGAILHARHFFQNETCFLVHNVDVLTTLDIRKMASYHQVHQGLATLAVRDRITSRYLLFDDEKNLAGWENARTGQKRLADLSARTLHRLAFSGVQILNPEIFKHSPSAKRFGLVDLFLNAATAGEAVVGYQHDEDSWRDLGTMEIINTQK